MVGCNRWILNKHPCFIVNFSLVKFFDKYTFFQFTMNFYKPLVCLKLYGECERPSPNKMGLIEIQFEFIMVEVCRGVLGNQAKTCRATLELRHAAANPHLARPTCPGQNHKKVPREVRQMAFLNDSSYLSNSMMT